MNLRIFSFCMLFVVSLIVALPNAVNGEWEISILDSGSWPYTIGCDITLQIDQNDSPRINYYNSAGPYGRSIKYAAWNGTVWDIQEISDEWTGCFSFCLDQAEMPHFSYMDFYDLFHQYWDGDQWQIEIVDTDLNFSNYTNGTFIRTDSDDNPHIAYFDVPEGDLKYAHKTETGWQFEIVRDEGFHDYNYDFTLMLDSEDLPHICYTVPADHDVIYACKTAGGWEFHEVIEDASTGFTRARCLALDSQDRPYIICETQGAYDLKYAFRNQQGWHVSVVAQSVRIGSILTDPEGNPHISYYDAVNQDLVYAHKQGNSWLFETVDADGNTGSGSSMMLDAVNAPHIAYQWEFGTGDSSKLKYARKLVTPAPTPTMEPTNASTPTLLPTDTPTLLPTHTPTSTPTPSSTISTTPTTTIPPTMIPTGTPSPKATGITPTHTPEYPLGVRIEMPEFVSPGEEFHVTGMLDNPNDPMNGVPVVFALNVFQDYWFWPHWTWFNESGSGTVDWQIMNIPRGTEIINVVDSFPWPDTGSQHLNGLYFFGAILNSEFTDILGRMAVVRWGYGP